MDPQLMLQLADTLDQVVDVLAASLGIGPIEPIQPIQPQHERIARKNLMRVGSNAVKNVNMVDPVTYEPIAYQDAVYLKPNVHQGKVHAVYDYNTINRWMKGQTTASSPLTHTTFRGQNVVRAFPDADIQKTIRFLQDAATILKARGQGAATGVKNKWVNNYKYDNNNLFGIGNHH